MVQQQRLNFLSSRNLALNTETYLGWAASVAYMNAVNNVVLRAAIKEAKQLDFEMDFDEADEYYDTTKVPPSSALQILLLQLIPTHFSTESN